ncbi:MAG: hypothetical protein FWE91_05720 [Defluviitaleaceae bacterium]|nr:hypothetical protein [Defluviitaleaceae bacterium]MCL2835332.1 hypothetical protein [Defluviitaleaceae bacterium]
MAKEFILEIESNYDGLLPEEKAELKQIWADAETRRIADEVRKLFPEIQILVYRHMKELLCRDCSM